MFNLTRTGAFDDVFRFQREVGRLLDQFWSDLPRTSVSSPGSLQVHTTDEGGWRIDVPLPGIDPRNVTLEVAGSTLSIRAEEGDRENREGRVARYEQAFTIPQFLDIEKLSATHRHGMLQLTLPLKESVKPRRIEIQNVTGDKKQLTAA